MDHVEIDVVEPEFAQAGVEGPVERVRRQLVVPDLRGDEELAPAHAGCRDGRAHGSFILVHRRGVDMSVAERDRALDDRLGVSTRHPERAEAKAGDRNALCGDGLHDVVLSSLSCRPVLVCPLACAKGYAAGPDYLMRLCWPGSPRRVRR